MNLALNPATLATLDLTSTLRLVVLEARSLVEAHVPPFPPDFPALMTGVDSPELAAHLRDMLLAVYPPEHIIVIVEEGRRKEERILDLGGGDFSASTCLYVPELAEGTGFESFQEIVAHLRAPDGCPWDREQTHNSLRTHLMEEAYETLEAIDSGEPASMREEFGDLLLQIVLNAQIASEAGQFNMSDVVKGIHHKIIHRHPHVFGDLELKDVNGVLQNWERLKEKERGSKNEDKGLLDGVPLSMPALTQAQEYQDRAARVGFDWPEIQGVLDKIREEIEEVKKAGDEQELAAEVGDLLFALVNLARWKKLDAESALRGTNMKFKKRFGYVEQGAKSQGRSLSDMTLEEMDALWNEAKAGGL
jgi:tetrapyrrole methylase family protein/MazG family protein